MAAVEGGGRVRAAVPPRELPASRSWRRWRPARPSSYPTRWASTGRSAEAGAGLVTTLDPADVAGAIGRLLDDPDAAERMGRAGEALAARRYSWERVATDVEALYEEVVGQASRETSPARTAAE